VTREADDWSFRRVTATSVISRIESQGSFAVAATAMAAVPPLNYRVKALYSWNDSQDPLTQIGRAIEDSFGSRGHGTYRECVAMANSLRSNTRRMSSTRCLARGNFVPLSRVYDARERCMYISFTRGAHAGIAH